MTISGTLPHIRTRQVVVEIRINGELINDWLSFRVTNSLNQSYAQATIVCTQVHGDYDQLVEIRAGTIPGNGARRRFLGLRRNAKYTLWPRAVEIQCVGMLARAAEYVNGESVTVTINGQSIAIGGLTIPNLVPDPIDGVVGFARASEIVSAVLTKANVSFDPANIGSTNRVYGFYAWQQTTNMFDPDWLWLNGLPVGTASVTQAARNQGFSTAGQGVRRTPGQTALDFIQKFDAIDAVYQAGPPKQGGFYRTIESINGDVHRVIVGGRPRSAVDTDESSGLSLTFEENVNILDGNVDRQYPLGNRTLVMGGSIDGVRQESFEAQIENPLEPLSLFRYDPQPPSSNMITRSTYSQWGPAFPIKLPTINMDCETVANARILDVSRETVQTQITTAEDWMLGPTQTHLIQGPAGSATPPTSRLGIGEKVWCTEVQIEVTKGNRGEPIFSQTILGVGGGEPDLIPPNDITAPLPVIPPGEGEVQSPLGSSAAEAVAMSLYDDVGGGNVSPPDGWEQNSFGDGGWDNAVLAENFASVIDTTEAIWSSGLPVIYGEEVLFKQSFSVPTDGDLSNAVLHVSLGGVLQDVFINGTSIEASGINSPRDIPVDIADLLPGEENWIAADVMSTSDSVAWFDYRLDVTVTAPPGP